AGVGRLRQVDGDLAVPDAEIGWLVFGCCAHGGTLGETSGIANPGPKPRRADQTILTLKLYCRRDAIGKAVERSGPDRGRVRSRRAAVAGARTERGSGLARVGRAARRL